MLFELSDLVSEKKIEKNRNFICWEETKIYRNFVKSFKILFCKNEIKRKNNLSNERAYILAIK